MVIKFYPWTRREAFRHEALFYENRLALEPETAAEYTPRRFDAFPGSMSNVNTEEMVPSALVLERGEFSLKVRDLSFIILISKTLLVKMRNKRGHKCRGSKSRGKGQLRAYQSLAMGVCLLHANVRRCIYATTPASRGM